MIRIGRIYPIVSRASKQTAVSADELELLTDLKREDVAETLEELLRLGWIVKESRQTDSETTYDVYYYKSTYEVIDG